jgi:hypothetical protein
VRKRWEKGDERPETERQIRGGEGGEGRGIREGRGEEMRGERRKTEHERQTQKT